MKTKLLFALGLTLMINVSVFGQKGSVTKAETLLNKPDYSLAKEEIDVAITLDKVKDKSRTWFVRGKIYEGIASSQDMAITSIDPQALEKAIEAYNKVKTMEKETSTYYTMSTLNMDALWGTLLNDGGTAYGEENYQMALAKFERALIVKPSDSTTLLYAGAAAQQLNDTKTTLKYYNQLIESGKANQDIYSTTVYYERLAENNDRALELVRKAKEIFPNVKLFGQEEISLLLTMNKMEEAENKLLDAIESDPNNINYRLNLGVLYDNLATNLSNQKKKEEAAVYFEKAKESYKKSVEIDPSNFVGNFNTGVIFVNMAKAYYDEVRDMNLKTYDKEGPAKLKKGDELLKQGLPYMEKAMQIKEDDEAGLQALQQMYVQLKMMDKAEAIMDKIDALEK